MIKIRQEAHDEYDEIGQVVKEAFDTAEHSDGNEHELVTALRSSDAFVPELSLVAVCDGKIVGHILFTKVKVGGTTQLALAPLSVLPGYQRQGIGTALIEAGHKKARESGYVYSIVLGSPAYYPKMGYVPAVRYGILPPFDVPSENFMACRLIENGPQVSGVVEYAKEFGI